MTTPYSKFCLGTVPGLLAVLTLAGCAGTVVIESEFPEPVVQAMPFSAGIYYSPEFSEYVFKEEEGKLEFELGTKQLAVYDKIFGALFEQTISVPSPDGDNSAYGVDLVLEPVLEEYAFLSPQETATNFYAVSMKYQIRLYSDQGTIVGYWPFVAYGKDRKKFVNGNESLGEATTLALRDAAAAMVSQFKGVVEKEQWRAPLPPPPETPPEVTSP
ncbi:MAG: hypothetical protein AB8B96_08765 [Lysobacterales bacterium]